MSGKWKVESGKWWPLTVRGEVGLTDDSVQLTGSQN